MTYAPVVETNKKQLHFTINEVRVFHILSTQHQIYLVYCDLIRVTLIKVIFKRLLFHLKYLLVSDAGLANMANL